MTTRRSSNGSSYRIPSDSLQAPRCPEDMEWLNRHLNMHRLKAYVPTISVRDPKNRRPSNEVVDWCVSDGYSGAFKLWSATRNAFVTDVRLVNNVRLRSHPTE